MTFFSPLEQFYSFPEPILYSQWSMGFFILFSFYIIYILCITKENTNKLSLIAKPLQICFEFFYVTIMAIMSDNIQSDKKDIFFSILTFFAFIVINLNLIGLLPFSFTVTSSLIGIYFCCFIVFFAIQAYGLKKHNIKLFSIFFPSGISIYLSLLLVPIEVISFLFKPISMAIRLFANLMAGHTLLKVIAAFIFIILNQGTTFAFFLHFIPIIIIVILYFLELAVAFIQGAVITVLFSIYINDIFNLH